MSDAPHIGPDADSIVTVTILSDVDPHHVGSDAQAQVIEHEIRRRLPGTALAIDFRSTATPTDPRRRTRWKPATGSAWARSATAAIDVGSTPSTVVDGSAEHVPLPDVSAWFAGLIDSTALETRRLMLAHLSIAAPPGGIGLTATDHAALGTFSATAPDESAQRAAAAAFDRIAELISSASPTSIVTIETLADQVEHLRSELAELRAEHAAWEHATQLELDRRAHAIRTLELRLGTTDGPS